MIAFLLLVAPLPVVAASLFAETHDISPTLEKDGSATSDELGSVLGSWKWLNSAKTTFVVHLWGAIVSLLPYFISQIPDSNPTTNFLIWNMLSMLSLEILPWILGSLLSHIFGLPQRSMGYLEISNSLFFLHWFGSDVCH